MASLKRWRNALMSDELYEEIVALRNYIDELEANNDWLNDCLIVTTGDQQNE